jgi:hypothetical protein
MSVREIPTSEWAPFLERLGREHRAWLTTVDRDGRVEAREEPLESISAAERIDIRLGNKSIRVDEPRSVRIEEVEGAIQALHIEDATRKCVSLRFRVAVAPGALDGLAPAER